ncbi:MAG: 3-hydroxyacyl-ACP dehydratase FabZ [Gammaproteobacteria bacterium]|jgi:3-hydroxyacyl-[acyl-carrier-protein] dehydratase|nr:3-hydroxyacyl-ACP dehydratase FabZ [Gammaproteobacteria bacterium]
MDVFEVMKHLPHRYPFLLVDRVLECTPGESVVAIKNVTINEPFFPGHFPQRPVMPGVLIMEAMAQASGMLAYRTDPSLEQPGSLYFFVGMDKVRFKRQVEPGDQLRFEVDLVRTKRSIWMFSGRALVDGQVAASGDLMMTVRMAEA